MGYQALLFCPDEKTARTVTQVLSELEFNVEPCNETFAAVKKLMGTHFDAVVVDCDNEQNATLLFKSARNSTSNQASLAVAVVEGQAGVAKAFRIGANLVLTKPINIEQAKGTLRVARGLLRKGEAPKAAAPAPGAPAAPAATPAVKAGPSLAKPALAKPVAPVKPATPPAASSFPVPPVAKPAAPAWPAKAAVASSVPAAHDHASHNHEEDLPELTLDDDVLDTPAAPASKLPAPAVPAIAAEAKPAFTATAQTSSSLTSGSGAASAPAPAREAQPAHIADVPTSPEPPAITRNRAEPVAPSESSSESVAEPLPTSFTFGGAAVPEEPGKSKKILLVAAVIVIVAAAAYAGWSYYQGRASQPVTPAPKPTTRTLTANPAPAQPVTAATPTPAAAIPASPTASQTSATREPTASPSANSGDSLPENDSPAASVKTTPNPAPTPVKSAPATAKAAAAAPLIVKGGKAPASHLATEATDAPAPSMMGMATTGSSAPPNIGGGAGSAPKPILQTVTVSQGVSQGLLIKKVAPIYPKTAMTMHIDGTVQLEATISKTGNITAIKVLSGDKRLVRAATDAVHQWKYKPYLLDGEPVEIQTIISLVFKSPN
jgi:periplasmic protein TonB